MKVGFKRIFWGLLFVVLDLRINSIDLFLPDFVGYILIVSGLGLLVPHDKWFQWTRVMAILLIFFSLSDLVEVQVDYTQAPKLRRELISRLTGDLGALLPQEIDSARLLHTTTSATAINENRTQNPERDEDRVLAEYSDGTVVLILRYASPEEAHEALRQKDKTDYSFGGIKERAKTDASFKSDHMTGHHGVSGSQITFSADSKVEAGERVIQQWWNRGRSWWWNSPSWYGEGSLLYIVEGHRTSADAYKAALEPKSQNGDEIRSTPLFQISAIGSFLDALFIWGLCSGVMDLSFTLNNYSLMQIARRRRNFYLVLQILGMAGLIMLFIAPEAMLTIGTALLIPYVFAVLVSVVLIMLLMRKAAKTL